MNRFAFVAFLFASGAVSADPMRFEYSEPHMGTTFRVVVYADSKAEADRGAKAVFARTAELNAKLSDYQADSELNKLCRRSDSGPSGPVPVSDELFFVLQKAHESAVLSDGAFDYTLGPVIRLWRTARKERRLPDADVLAAARKRTGYKNVLLDPVKKTVDLRVAGMQLDLGGIAKGYAADEGLRVLANHGIARALVAASGDIAVGAAPPGRPGWKVDVGALPGTNISRSLRLVDCAVSTSGDAEQFVEIGGVRYSHVIDPKTGIGLTGRRSVTVVARRGYAADSMTKMGGILPPDRMIEIIEKIDGAAVFMVVKTDAGVDVKQSQRFEPLLWK